MTIKRNRAIAIQALSPSRSIAVAVDITCASVCHSQQRNVQHVCLTLAMSRYLLHRVLLILLFTSFLTLLVVAHVHSSNSSPTSSHSYLATPSLIEQLWSGLERLLSSDIGFALLVLPFSLSAFPVVFLLLRKSSSSSSLSDSSPYPTASSYPISFSKTSPSTSARYSSTSSPLTAPIPITHCTATQHSTEPTSDFLIVGCGVAGATLSTLLARRGYAVTCIERDMAEPHRIVGELMQPGGCKAMEEMGLGELLTGFDAQVVRGYTIIKAGESNLVLQYPRLEGEESAEGEVREEGRSFHNGRFVQSLRRAAQKENHCTIVEGSVTSLLEEDGVVVGAVYQRKTSGGELEVVRHRAAMTIVADGCLSAFRRQLLSSQQQKLSSFLGLILTNCPLPTASHGHVILAQPTPILAYPISSTEVRMLIDFPNGTLPADKALLTSHLLSFVLPQLPPMMHASFREAVETGRLSSMPNQSLLCRPIEKRGVLLVGDSSNMRHPLTGGGMTVAMFNCRQLLHSLAHYHVHDMNDTANLHRAIHHYYTNRTARVKVINILADALYNVFCASYDALREACFHYLAEGERCSGGPVRLLSGISQSQALLVYHFYSVALYGVRRAVWPWKGLAAISDCADMMRDACRIILPLLARENEQDSLLVRAVWSGWKRLSAGSA